MDKNVFTDSFQFLYYIISARCATSNVTTDDSTLFDFEYRFRQSLPEKPDSFNISRQNMHE